MTSARALPTEERPNDWRMELRVVGFWRTETPLWDVASGGIVGGREQGIYVQREKNSGGSRGGGVGWRGSRGAASADEGRTRVAESSLREKLN